MFRGLGFRVQGSRSKSLGFRASGFSVFEPSVFREFKSSELGFETSGFWVLLKGFN